MLSIPPHRLDGSGLHFSPEKHCRFHTWGVAPAGMDRASGPLEMVSMINPHLKERTKALKARTISAWGSAPGTIETEKNKGCKPAP